MRRPSQPQPAFHGSRPIVSPESKSPVDGIYRYGPMIQQAGSYEFVVGNPALTARVINALSGQAIAGLDVTVYRQNAEGSPIGSPAEPPTIWVR